MRGIATKKVLVTGAAGGIGRATAQRFYDEGAFVLVNDVRPQADVAYVAAWGERAAYVQADVSSAAGVQVLDNAMAAHGIDVLVNNAGVVRDASVSKMTLEDWDKVIGVNLTGVFRLSQAAAQHMKKNKAGVFLNAASVVAHNGNFGQANYVASKAGVIGLTKTLARELGRFGVRVNAVAPGFIDTDMVKGVPSEVLSKFTDRTPLLRLGKPEEIAAAYCFLASDDAQYITGTCLNVDGGLVL
jgi:3-oxoacyl-[acyl-carrier protein] reductase